MDKWQEMSRRKKRPEGPSMKRCLAFEVHSSAQSALPDQRWLFVMEACMTKSPDLRHLIHLPGRPQTSSSLWYLFALGLGTSGTKSLEQTHPLLVPRRLPFLELTKEHYPLRRVRKIWRRQVCVEDAQRTVMSEASPSIPPHLPGSVQKSYQLDCSALFAISRHPTI